MTVPTMVLLGHSVAHFQQLLELVRTQNCILSHKMFDTDYHIGSNFWKFYLLELVFTLCEPGFFGESV
jgi:hypothetical protein